MIESLNKVLSAAKAAIIAGNPHEALEKIENFTDLLEGKTLGEDERNSLEARVAELRQLAGSAQSGAQNAVEQIRAIIEAARSLQTYDRSGKLHVARVTPQPARRF